MIKGKFHFSVLVMILAALFLNACKKEEVMPSLTTLPVTEITRTSGLFEATITNNGDDSIYVYGFSLRSTGLSKQPTLYETWTYNNGSFKDRASSLLTGTKYYVRSYVKTETGTAYGNEVSFTTKPGNISITFNPNLSYGQVSDIDGNIYKTIRIGNQDWMAENLRTTRYNDGKSIPLVEDNETWIHLQTHGYSWYENDKEVLGKIYGTYYNWYAVSTGFLCPVGWHVASNDEWKTLEITLGISEAELGTGWGPAGTNEGNKIKESGTVNWAEGSTTATNESGFTALPGGNRSDYFTGEGLAASWWTSTPIIPFYMARSYHLIYNDSRIWHSDMLGYVYGLNVRCIRDI